MMTKEKITGIILAGGKSSRMKENKAFVKINNIPFIEHILNNVKGVCDKVMIIANSDQYDKYGVVYHDLVKESGPLAGINTGLHYSNTFKNLVVSCDVPFITTKLLQYLIDESKECDIVLPSVNGKTHQLIGIYTKNCQAVFERELMKGNLKLAQVNELLNLKKINIDTTVFEPNTFLNINTPEQLINAKHEYEY